MMLEQSVRVMAVILANVKEFEEFSLSPLTDIMGPGSGSPLPAAVTRSAVSHT